MIKTDINNEILFRKMIIKLSLMQLNKKYEHGKHGPDTFDCAGFVWYVYNDVCQINIYNNGIGLSTTTKIMTSSYGKIILFKENDINKDISILKEGDIIFFHRQSLNDSEPKYNNKYPGHCGIYLNNNNFIHCSRSKGKVIITSFNENYWRNVLVGSKIIISENKILNKKI